MIGKILSSKVVTGIAYTVIGSQVVKSSINMENARKVVNATMRAATTTCLTVRGKAAELKDAVNKRKLEILTVESGADTEVPEGRVEEEAPHDAAF